MKCPFFAPLTKTTAACCHAQEVVRRGGTEFDCRSEPDHVRCEAVFAGLKARGLAAFAVEDDLTQIPHSVLVKIQAGGLLGLQRLVKASDDAGAIADIAQLVRRAVEQFGDPECIPYAELDADMTAFRLERRSERRHG